jgi:hypothetical protein
MFKKSFLLTSNRNRRNQYLNGLFSEWIRFVINQKIIKSRSSSSNRICKHVLETVLVHFFLIVKLFNDLKKIHPSNIEILRIKLM